MARRSHQDSAVRLVTAKSWPERATKTRLYDLLWPNVGQKEPPRLGSTICYGQTWARKSHRDSAIRFVTPNVGQKEPPRLGRTICCGQTWARKSHQDSAIRFVTAKSWPERATETRPYDLLRPRVGQKEPRRLGSTFCYGHELARKSHQDSAVRFVTAKSLARKSHQDSVVRFVPAKSCPEKATKTRQYGLISAKSWPERATKTRQYDLLRPRVDQKEPPYDLLQPKVGKKEPPRLGSTICYGQELARKSHRDSAVRLVTAKCGPERATKTRQYDLLRPFVGQKEPARLDTTICYGQELARKSHQDSAVRFVTAKNCPERAIETRYYDSLRQRVRQYDL